MAKRQKRVSGSKRSGLAKRFSSQYINTGRSINKIGMDSLYKRILSPDPFLVTLFGADSNKGGQPRIEALALREKIIQQVDPKRHFKVLETEKLKVLLYYVNPVDGFFFVQYEKETGTIRKSLTYKSKQRAMRYFNADGVRWIEIFRAPFIVA